MAEKPKTYMVVGKVVLRKIGDEVLLLPVSGPAAGGRVYPLNETARIIWDGLSAGVDCDQIADRLAGIFAVPRDQAFADCIDCARMMVEESLLDEVA